MTLTWNPTMTNHSVKFYKGDYSIRQAHANTDRAVCYVEHHFNSSVNTSAAYSVAIVASNASETSIAFARHYTKLVCEKFGTKPGGDGGVMVGGYGGRGNANLIHTKMPAILLEPLFASNPSHAAIIRSPEGIESLAQILVDTIGEFFPGGGLIAFSVGHKYKTSNPSDRGASVHGGGTEADYAEKVLIHAAKMLEAIRDGPI